MTLLLCRLGITFTLILIQKVNLTDGYRPPSQLVARKKGAYGPRQILAAPAFTLVLRSVWELSFKPPHNELCAQNSVCQSSRMPGVLIQSHTWQWPGLRHVSANTVTAIRSSPIISLKPMLSGHSTLPTAFPVTPGFHLPHNGNVPIVPLVLSLLQLGRC